MDNTPIKKDEIDLGPIFKKIGQLFSRLWSFIISFINNCLLIIRRKWWLIAIFFLLGAGGGAILYKYSEPIYTSSLTLSSSLLSNAYCSDLINDLELVIKDQAPVLLAKKLNIDTNSAKAIKRIEYNNYYTEKEEKKYSEKDTGEVVLDGPFKIKAYVGDPSVFETLQPALVNYLENNKYALKRKEIAIRNIYSLKEKISKEIKDLDSLKFTVAGNMTPRGTENGFVFGQPIDPLNIFREGISLFKEDLSLSTSLELIDNIQVIQEFVGRSKPDSPKLLKNIVLCGAGGFLLGMLLAFFVERKKILVRA